MRLFGLTVSQQFLQVLSLDLSALPALGAAALARKLLRKAPRRAVCLLWLVVWLRLLVPFTIEVPWGLPGGRDIVPDQSAAAVEVPLTSALDAAQWAVRDVLNGGMGTTTVHADQPAAGEMGTLYHREVWLAFFAWVWQLGATGMLAYSAVSLARLRRRLTGAVRLEGNVYLADRAGSPFVLGVLRPKIYLPSDLPETDRELILRHERAHIRGGHHLLKPLAFLALSVHWFNPLLWWAFHLFVSDLEMACDEAAAAGLDRARKADYAGALLRLSAPRRAALGAPLAFGEGDPKSRIKRVLEFKRPRAWAAAGVTVLAVGLGAFLLTSRGAGEEFCCIGAEYETAEVVYQNGDSYGSANYFVSGDYHLWTWDNLSAGRNSMTDLGELKPYGLTREELLRYGPIDEFWQSGKPGRITQAWWLRVNESDMSEYDGTFFPAFPAGRPAPASRDGGFSDFYTLFRTSDGETWLACGREDYSERAPHGDDPSDDTYIRWLVKLEQAPAADISGYFDTDVALALGVNVGSTMSGVFEVGEKDAAYVYFFDLPEGGVGFAVYRGGSRGGLFTPDRSALVLRTALYTYSLDELKEAAPGSGVYPLPVGVALEYDGKADMRSPVLCLNEKIYDIERTVTRNDGTVLSREREAAMGRDMAFFQSSPDTAGGAVTSYRFFNDLGNELFFADAETGGTGHSEPAVGRPGL